MLSFHPSHNLLLPLSYWSSFCDCSIFQQSPHLANNFVLHHCLLTHCVSTIHDHHFPQTYINLSERSEAKWYSFSNISKAVCLSLHPGIAMMSNILQCFLSFCRFTGHLQVVSQRSQSYSVGTSGIKNLMCMLFGFAGGNLVMWRSVGGGILSSKWERVRSQAKIQCLFLMKHRCRTRMGNSGMSCSKAYMTTPIVTLLPLWVMAVHLHSST